MRDYEAEINALRERAEAAEKEVSSSMREASQLAMFLYRRFYREVSPDFELIEYPSGVLSQVDNMLAGVIEMLNAARRAEAAAWNDAIEAAAGKVARYMIGAGVGSGPFHKLNQEIAADIRALRRAAPTGGEA